MTDNNEEQVVFKKGDQIACIPDHANGDLHHPDCELGFVVSKCAAFDAYFCRYWRKGHPGELRTTSCSEITEVRHLRRIANVVPQEQVTKLLQELYP